MTTDLTTITTPYGLLDEDTQKAMKECGGPWQYYGRYGWGPMDERDWYGELRNSPQAAAAQAAIREGRNG